MNLHRQRWIVAISFTAVLMGLMSFALSVDLPVLGWLFFPTVLITVAYFLFLLPGSMILLLALANFMSIYACVFLFIYTVNFSAQVANWAVIVGFLLPLSGFMLGAWLQKAKIQYLVKGGHKAKKRPLLQATKWLLPILFISALTFFVPGFEVSPLVADIIFVLAMALVALMLVFLSLDLSAFFLSIGLLFEEFFAAIRQLLEPAYIFFVAYSVQVIVFATFYKIIDAISLAPHFLYQGDYDEISFLQALYFSMITVSTTGYGDIVPGSPVIELVSAVQVMVGILLILFGYSEIMRYMTHHRQHPDTLPREDLEAQNTRNAVQKDELE